MHVAAGAPRAGARALRHRARLRVRRSHDPTRDQFLWSERLPARRRLGEVQQALLARGRLRGLRPVLLRPDVPRAALDQADRGRVAWAPTSSPQTLVDTTAGRLGCDGATCTSVEPLCARVTLPGDRSSTAPTTGPQPPIGERLAELTGGELLARRGRRPRPARPRPGAGQPRDPARSPSGSTRRRRELRGRGTRRARAASGRKRALYLSSPIGLGHARRDLAVADELRELHPDLQVDWLAQDPVTRVLADHRESIHPASAHLASESGHIEAECGEHDLHAFRAVRRMDEILINNFMVFDELLERRALRPGDRRRGLGRRLLPAREPRAQAVAVRLADRLRRLAADARRWRGGGGADRRPQRRDARAARPLPPAAGPVGLRRQRRRRRARQLRPRPAGDPRVDRGELRLRRLRDRLRPGEPRRPRRSCGRGSATAPTRRSASCQRRRLRCRAAAAATGPRRRAPGPPARRRTCGSSSSPARGSTLRSLPERDGAEVHGYLPDLHRPPRRLRRRRSPRAGSPPAWSSPPAPSRSSTSRCGTTSSRTSMSGTGSSSTRAGTCVDYAAATDPDALAAMLVKELGREVDYRPVETDGAARAARCSPICSDPDSHPPPPH